MEAKDKVKRAEGKFFSALKKGGTASGLVVLMVGSLVVVIALFLLSIIGLISFKIAEEALAISVLLSMIICGLLFYLKLFKNPINKVFEFPVKVVKSFYLKPDLDVSLKRLLVVSVVSYFLFFSMLRYRLPTEFYNHNVWSVFNPFLFYGFLIVVFSLIYYRIKDSHVNGYLVSGSEKFFLLYLPLASLLIWFAFFDGLSLVSHILFYGY